MMVTSEQRVESPASGEECAALLRECAEKKLTTSASGGGTKMGWGNPVCTDVLLKTEKMSGMREHSWQDMTAIVGAGTTWSEMQSVLAQHGQHGGAGPTVGR